jgi:hypothetical protein
MKLAITPDLEAYIFDVLTSCDSNLEAAKRWGKHRSTVSLIRLGKLHADVLPDIPRWGVDLRCENCLHWSPDRSDPCDLGHRDPIEEGTRFAKDCATFTKRREQ